MFLFMFVFFIALGLFLLFGFYSLNLTWEYLPQNHLLSFRFFTWKKIFGIEYQIKDQVRIFGVILAGKSFVLKSSKIESEEKQTLFNQKKNKNLISKIKKRKVSKSFLIQLLKRLPAWYNCIIKRIKFNHCRCQGIVGTGDPAMTGQIYGYLQSVHYLTDDAIQIQLIPDFNQCRFETSVEFSVRLILANILFWLFYLGFQTTTLYIKYR